MMTAVWLLTGGFVALALVWLRDRLAGFSAQRPADYADAPGEAMDIRRHLNGALEAEGVIYGPTGRVTSRFRGDFVATWEGNTCVLHERYLYASGVEEERAWHLTLGNDGRIRHGSGRGGRGQRPAERPVRADALPAAPAGGQGRHRAERHGLDVSHPRRDHREPLAVSEVGSEGC